MQWQIPDIDNCHLPEQINLDWISNNGNYSEVIKYKTTYHARNKMSKQQHRSDLGIISDVLETTMDYGVRGAVVSSIARGANLSHYTAVDKCQRLVELGLMQSASNERNQTYSITEKGIHFFHEMQRFIEVVEQAKIRY